MYIAQKKLKRNGVTPDNTLLKILKNVAVS